MTAARGARASCAGALVALVVSTAGCAIVDDPRTALVQVVDSGMSSGDFVPSVLVVEAGTEVRWRNVGARPYVVVTADDRGGAPAVPRGSETWDSGPLRPGEVFALRLDVPGTYVYRGVDDEMVGTIRVEAR